MTLAGPVAAVRRTVQPILDRLFPPGAVLLSVLTLGYFAMGQLRNRVFAQTYGLSPELDAYNAAFRIPEIALDVLVAAGLTAPFVPIFSSLRRTDERAANDFGRTVLTAAVAVMSVAIVALFVLAPVIADTFVRDFSPEIRETYIRLFRINLIAQVLFAASITIGEVLVANQRFLFYALAPILYTGGIVLGTMLFADTYGIDATAWGAVCGALAHLGIRALGTFRTTFRIRPAFRIRTPAFREFVTLMLPRMVSYPIEPIALLYFTSVAAAVGVGNVAVLNFALDYQVVPISLIAVTFSLAVFPALSAAYADGDRARFRAIVRRNVLTIGVLTTIAAVMLLVGSGLLVEVLLGGGEFDADAIARTSLVLAVFAISIPFDSLSYPLSRALYATHNTALQVIAALAGLGALVLVTTLLVPVAGILAIPLGYAAGVATKVVLLSAFLIPRMRRIRPPVADRGAAAG